MKSTVETVEPTRAKLTVEVDYDELKPHMDAAYKDIAGQVEIPGFRKGKVPPRIIDQRFGRGAVIEQVVNESLPGYYGDALQENELRPMAQPQIDVVEVPATEGEPGGVLKFTAEVDVVPAFELPSLEDITVEVEATEVSDEAVQEELDQLRGRFATLKTLERPAEDGDYLSLDLSVDVNGKNIDSLSDVSYELGSGTMLDGMDEALRGKSAGDEVVFVAPIKGGEYAGEDGDVTAKVLSVKERELPEVDEDFVQMVSEFDTIEELTEDLKKQVATRTKSDQALAARNALLEKLIAETEILLPEAPVAAEVDERVDESTTDEERKELREKIEGEIRQQIFLDTLAAKQEVKIAQQELIDFMLHTSQTFGIDPNQLFSDQNQIQGMMGELARTKALVSVLRNTKVVDTNGEEVDISEFTRDPAEDVEVVTDPEGE